MTQKLFIGVATLALVVALGVAMYTSGQISKLADTLKNLAGLTNFDELVLTGASLKFEKIELVAGDDDQAYTNLSDHTEFVKLGQIITSGRASSSFDLALFASSSACSRFC